MSYYSSTCHSFRRGQILLFKVSLTSRNQAKYNRNYMYLLKSQIVSTVVSTYDLNGNKTRYKRIDLFHIPRVSPKGLRTY